MPPAANSQPLPAQPRCQRHRRVAGRRQPVYERTPGAARAPLPRTYRRRRPEQTTLYQLVQEELASFLAQVREQSPYGAGLPGYIEQELRAYLDCGILAHGFARVRCKQCGEQDLVAFSCKGRGLCPSCTARRMHDTAAHLVDRVLPHVPVRHLVLTFPRRIRWHLAQDPKLAGQALRLFVRALHADLRRRGRRQGIAGGRPAAIAVTQRFGSNLRLNHHIHALVPDGLFVLDPERPDQKRPRFRPLKPPSDEDVSRLLAKVARRVVDLLRRSGRLDDQPAEPPDALQLTLAVAAGQPTTSAFEPRPRALCARLDGFSLDAQVRIHENDREGLERLCQYVLRPPLAVPRLTLLDDGNVRYRMKRTLFDGTREILLSRHQLLARLCALIPPPRRHTISYFGALAANARGRAALTGQPPPAGRAQTAPTTAALACLTAAALAFGTTPPGLPPSAPTPTTAAQTDRLGDPPPRPARKRTLDWADLLRRAFAIDVLTCGHCGGPRQVIAFITEPKVVAQILDHLGLPSTPPPLAPCRGPPDCQPPVPEMAPAADYFVDPPAID